MTGLTQPPEAVVGAAHEADGSDDVRRVNVVVADPDADGRADLTDDGYKGPDAVACGHLAAALSVADVTETVDVHHGDVDLTNEGPWLVLAPLSGLVATVATGTATATVTVPIEGDTRRIAPVEKQIDAVLSAARARHDHYPVDDDEQGVFRTGMTTFSFVEATVDDGLRVQFDVSTTPATTRSAIHDRFASVAPSATVDVDFEAGVERAAPSSGLRDAVESAHRAVVGDAGYEWLPRPIAFSWLPSSEKVAFGGGHPGERFTHEDFERTRDLLRETIERLPREVSD